MNVCKHKKLLAYQLLKQFESGLIVNEEVYYLVPKTLEIYCEKCISWQSIKVV